MGSALSYFWSADVTVNADAKLTSSELQAVRNTWENVRKESATVGMSLFFALFENHPDYQKMFSAFPCLTSEELTTSSKFRAHCVTVMYAFSSFVDHLDQPECLKEIIYKVAQNHLSRGATGKHFKDFTCLVIGGLKARYGMSAVAESGWSKVISFIDATMEEGLAKSS